MKSDTDFLKSKNAQKTFERKLMNDAISNLKKCLDRKVYLKGECVKNQINENNQKDCNNKQMIKYK